MKVIVAISLLAIIVWWFSRPSAQPATGLPAHAPSPNLFAQPITKADLPTAALGTVQTSPGQQNAAFSAAGEEQSSQSRNGLQILEQRAKAATSPPEGKASWQGMDRKSAESVFQSAVKATQAPAYELIKHPFEAVYEK